MSEGFKGLRIYNTLTRSKEDFVPIDPDNVRMYVCGPTVYDFAHIGNARPVIVFDVLFRLLRHLYGEEHVTYVRNITDVDDKINARALRDYPGLPLNVAIHRVTEKTADQFHRDVTALGCLPPTVEPRATEFVVPRIDGKPDMTSMIQSLIDRGHAYVAEGESGTEVLFDVASMPDYGRLSRRNLEDQQAGARIEVKDHKKSPGDFVLWKESGANEPGWNSTFEVDGKDITIHGRPGWHIECSAMSAAYLGDTFDIHGGGLDLIFPHHENEIAQSCCAHGTDMMAKYWMHNGFLQVEGKKMAKSEGNFVTIRELLETEKFGGRKWPGEVLRLAMLMTNYREPIDFSVRRLEEAESKLSGWRAKIGDWNIGHFLSRPDEVVQAAVCSDLDMAQVFFRLNELEKSVREPDVAKAFAGSLRLLGLVPYRELQDWLDYEQRDEDHKFGKIWDKSPPLLIKRPTVAEFLLASRSSINQQDIVAAVGRRAIAIRDKNWAEADRIRDELLAQGIQLKDGKDPATGERVTTWEVKR